MEAHSSRIYYACIDCHNKALGAFALTDLNLEQARVEIGGIFFGKSMKKTRLATECVFLLLNYCFEGLKMERVEWRCNSLNKPSKKAAERFGFKYEGKMRSQMLSKEGRRDVLIFSTAKHKIRF